MSWEAWGSDEPATHWEETIVRTQMDAAIARFGRWVTDYKAEFPSVEFAALVDHVIDTFDVMQAELSGKI